MTTLDLINQSNSTIPYELLTFSDSQPHIKIKSGFTQLKTDIRTRLSSPSDLLLLLQATEILRHEGVKEIDLFISYLLGARMDRRMNKGEAITLKIIADIINAQRYDRVQIFDPHSEVSTTLIDRSESVWSAHFIEQVLLHVNNVVLISPDAGASKKTEKLGHLFNLSVCYCTKSRDPKTGYLSNVKVDDLDINGKDCLIVDDICDGGRTFLNLISPLYQKGARKIFLAVSHGIFSQGLDSLHEFDQIFTTNSYKQHIKEKNLTPLNIW